jgi:GNAT superfamily N-acetyltransferase
MKIRPARRSDLLAIGRVADAAHWQTYRALIGPGAISELMRREYSPSALKRKLLSGGVLVAESHDGEVVGFAHVRSSGDHVEVAAISTDPEHRRRGAAGALVEAVRGAAPELPLCADVLLGNLEAERFYEAMGFAPGEVIQQQLENEQVVARRWWASPVRGGTVSASG